MDELLEQFAIEAHELVQQAAQDLMLLEGNPGRHENLESAFRAIHTLKGSVGLFDLGPMLGILHQAEDLLSQARAGRIAVDGKLIDPLLSVIEWVDSSIYDISQTGKLSKAQANQAPRLSSLLAGEMTDRDDDGVNFPSSEVPEWALSLSRHVPGANPTGTLVAIRYEPHPECFFNGDDPLATITRLSDLRHLAISLKDLGPPLRDYDPFRCNLLIEAVSGNPLADAEAVFRLIPDQVTLVTLRGASDQADANAPKASTAPLVERQSNTMRVDSARIDKLVEIAGELVTAKNGLVPLAEEARNNGDAPLARRILANHQEIERLVGALYSTITQARMIPLEHTFRRFPRLVRETSSRLDKAMDLIIEGETVEADREIVEALFEPLLHLVRNALDHGIELEADRLQQSKSARGRLLMRARQRGDRIEIQLADDGCGIDPQHVRAMAISRGLISESQASALTELDILQLVFAPGFSTASAVSDLSGRGVGLDAVQTAVKRLDGKLELQSSVGKGTTFTMSLPISFSMTQLMLVEVGAERYGIPISDIVETQKLPIGAVQNMRAGQAFVLRDQIIPLVYLGELLQTQTERAHVGDLKVLIVRTGEGEVGVVIDAISERAETLTRPLTGLLQGVPGIAGTTLLGDGKVLLVLDMEELVQ